MLACCLHSASAIVLLFNFRVTEWTRESCLPACNNSAMEDGALSSSSSSSIGGNEHAATLTRRAMALHSFRINKSKWWRVRDAPAITAHALPVLEVCASSEVMKHACAIQCVPNRFSFNFEFFFRFSPLPILTPLVYGGPKGGGDFETSFFCKFICVVVY